jgi:hypothetical protein
MMMMEAIRLSLASEDERLKREEKEARKEAKKREKEKEKEAKKADKVARKTGLYSNNASTSVLDVPGEPALGKVTSSSSSVIGEDVIGEEVAAANKGKGVDRASPSTQDSTTLLPSSSLAPPDQTPSEPSRPSHLRHVSSASSSFSSLIENTPEERTGSHPAADSNTSLEPMLNFRSLAAVIGDEEKVDECAEHVEDTSDKPQAEGSSSSAAPSVHHPLAEATPEAVLAVELRPGAEDDHAGRLPKELETRSVEITSPSTHPEAT